MTSDQVTSREYVLGRERVARSLGLHMRFLAAWLRGLCEQLRAAGPGSLDDDAREDARRLQVLLHRVGEVFADALYWQREREAEAAAQAAVLAARRADTQSRLVYVGALEPPPRHQLLGWRRAESLDEPRPFAITREGGQVIAAVGSTGSGKSQTLLTILDGRLEPVAGLTSDEVPPTAALVVACTPGAVALPELLAALHPNDRAADVELLHRRLGVAPAGLAPPRLLVPRGEIDEVHRLLRAELGAADARRVEIIPLVLSPRALGQVGLEALLGVNPDDAPEYMNDVLARALELGDDLSHPRLVELIGAAGLSRPLRQRAQARVASLGAVLDPGADADSLLSPGTLTLAMLCGRGLRQAAALPLLLALFHAALLPRQRGAPVQRFLGLDEVDILGDDPLLFKALSRLIRRARHLGADLWLSGQDLLALPPELLGLVTQFLCFRLRSARTFALLRERVAGLLGVPFTAVCDLVPGSALWVPTESTDPAWSGRAASVILRPPRCRHGGATRAVR